VEEVPIIFSPPPPSPTTGEGSAAAEKKCWAGKQGGDESWHEAGSVDGPRRQK
jgi:hypothetical protein